MGEALQAGTAGAHAHQQGVVDEPIGQHQGVAFRQGRHGGEVGLEAAGKEQHPLAAEPGGQGGLQLLVDGPGAGDQAGGPGPQAAGGQFGRGGREHGGMAAQAEVVVAGQIQQGERVARGCGLEAGGGGGLKGAQGAAADGGQGREGVAQLPSPGGLGAVGSPLSVVGEEGSGRPDTNDRGQSGMGGGMEARFGR